MCAGKSVRLAAEFLACIAQKKISPQAVCSADPLEARKVGLRQADDACSGCPGPPARRLLPSLIHHGPTWLLGQPLRQPEYGGRRYLLRSPICHIANPSKSNYQFSSTITALPRPYTITTRITPPQCTTCWWRLDHDKAW